MSTSKSGVAKKTAAKKASTSTASSKKQSSQKSGAAGSKGGAANSAFMKPVQPSEELSVIIGDEPLPRTEVTKRVWDYIKKNNLQDPKNKRMINGDEALQKVFGGKKQVSMFEMTKLVNQHLK